MRILKYRVYIKPLKRYAKDYETILYHHQCNMEPSWTVNISPDEYYGDEDLVIEQFTGLLDRNGKEIYEGDIVKISNLKPIFEVKYSIPFAEFLMESNGELYEEFQYWNEKEAIEVIGNIHEPPKDFRSEHLKRMGVTMVKGENKW